MTPSLNEHIYRLSDELWDVHLTLAKSGGEELLDPDLLRGLRAAADYVRHSLWVRDEHVRDPVGRTLEQILLTQRLKRAAEMLASALSQVQDLHLSADDTSPSREDPDTQFLHLQARGKGVRKPGGRLSRWIN